MKMTIRLAAATLLAAAGTVQASIYTWVPTSGTGSFQEAANWNPSTGVPGAADNALFTGAGTYAVTFNGAVTNAGTTVGTGSPGADVTFDLNGWLWRLTGTLGFASVGTARFGGGSLETGTPPAIGASQKLVLNSGTSLFGGVVTTASGGAIEVNGGNHSFGRTTGASDGLTLAAPPAGGMSLRITNGTASVTGQTLASAGAKVAVEGGTFLIPSGAYGFVINGPSTFDIYTNATFVSRADRFYFGRGTSGLSTMTIRGGTFTNTGPFMAIGAGNKNPTMALTGAVHLVEGQFYSSTSVSLGGKSGSPETSNSVGILRLSGGQFILPATLFLGNYLNSKGFYTQEGGSAYCRNLELGTSGRGSRGELHLLDGTLALMNPPAIGNFSESTGLVYQTGGTLLVSNNLNVGSAAGGYGLYQYGGGNAWVNGSVNLGNAAGAFGRMVIDGGSSLSVKTSLNVGASVSSTGELAIAGGSLVLDGGSETSPSLSVGLVSNSVGRVVKTGGDLLMGRVFVGHGAWSYGELLISGGTLAVTSKVALVVGGYSGYFNAVGRVEISGGTNWFDDARIGHQALGILRISGGQTYVTNAADYVFVVGNMTNGTAGRLELAGGVLTARGISGGGCYAEALLDGGTLQYEGLNNGNFLSNFDRATLTDRGAVFDTAGYMVALTQALSNETGHAGAFTKRGAGTLTLTSADNAFNGRVTVEAGELLVSGALYLTGGMRIDEGAVLNLVSAAVRDAATASGTVSRIDGTLRLAAGGALTNGLGAALYGGGTVTGSVVFASGSAWAHAKADYTGPLHVTGDTVFEDGTTVNLTGYSVEELSAGVPLVEIVGSGSVQVSGRIPVTLDGASHPYWWANVSGGGKTLTARMIPTGTMIQVR